MNLFPGRVLIHKINLWQLAIFLVFVGRTAVQFFFASIALDYARLVRDTVRYLRFVVEPKAHTQ